MAASRAALALVALVIVASAVQRADAARELKQVEAYNNARVIRPAPAPMASRSALTPENAEATANPAFNGVHRLVAPPARRTYSTVEAQPAEGVNTQNRAIAPRARSAQDVPGGPNRANGNPSMPALVLGGVAQAQTYTGATAISTTDSLALNRGGDASAISGNKRTTRTGALRGASTTGSMGVTSNQGVGSKALTGAANGPIVLAQANEAVALSQGERA